jgi:hypothetical protein
MGKKPVQEERVIIDPLVINWVTTRDRVIIILPDDSGYLDELMEDAHGNKDLIMEYVKSKQIYFVRGSKRK